MATIERAIDAFAPFVVALLIRQGLKLSAPTFKQHRRQAIGEAKRDRLGDLSSFPVREVTARVPHR